MLSVRWKSDRNICKKENFVLIIPHFFKKNYHKSYFKNIFIATYSQYLFLGKYIYILNDWLAVICSGKNVVHELPFCTANWLGLVKCDLMSRVQFTLFNFLFINFGKVCQFDVQKRGIPRLPLLSDNCYLKT